MGKFLKNRDTLSPWDHPSVLKSVLIRGVCRGSFRYKRQKYPLELAKVKRILWYPVSKEPRKPIS